MNARQGSLLRALLNEAEYKTCAWYAHLLGCSEKTVRTDVKAIDGFLRHEGFSSRVSRRRGSGLRLVLAAHEANRLSRLLDESEAAMHPRFERLCRELVVLTCAPGPHTVESLTRAVFTNKQQMQTDLHWWQRVLVGRGLAVRTGRRIEFVGAEWTQRGFLMSVLFSFPPQAVRRRIEPLLLDAASGCDQRFFDRCIEEIQDNLGFPLSSNARWQLGVYLRIMVARIQMGHVIADRPPAGELSGFFACLGNRLSRHFGIAVNEAEMGLLQDMVNCCTWQWSAELVERYEPNDRARAMADDIAAACEAAFGEPVPASLIRPLGILVESGLTRRACGLVVQNPNELAVKYDSMDGMCLLSSVLCEVPALVEARLHTSDYTRLVLVLVEYLERVGSLRHYRVGLVVNSGIDLALWGRYRIEKLSSRVQVVDVIAENEVLSACARPSSPLLDRFDFLVSFEPLAVDFPSVTISSLVDERDLERIVEAIPLWHRGREVQVPCERVRLTVPAAPSALLPAVHRDLVASGAVSFGLERFRWLVRTLGFIRERSLALAWCGEGVERTAVHLYNLDGGPQLAGKRCAQVALLLVRADDRGDLTPLTERFKRLLESQGTDGAEAAEDDFFPGFPELRDAF